MGLKDLDKGFVGEIFIGLIINQEEVSDKFLVKPIILTALLTVHGMNSWEEDNKAFKSLS